MRNRKMRDPLKAIKIASPCKADWSKMNGDERSRFCELCKLNVYNLSGMTKKEAHQLLEKKEGRLCIRLFRRSDGTVITKDCPVGLRALQKTKILITMMLSSILGVFVFFPTPLKEIIPSSLKNFFEQNQSELKMGRFIEMPAAEEETSHSVDDLDGEL